MLLIRNRVPSAWQSVLMLGVLLAGLLAVTAPHARAATAEDVSVSFSVQATTEGETLLVSGSAPQLGAWDPAKAVPLGTTASAYPHWTTSIRLPAGLTVQYKYLKRSPTGVVTWENTPNRTLTVSPDGPGNDDRWNVAPVTATFRVTATTTWGQNLYVSGNLADLGAWDPAKALPLATDSSAYPLWNGTHQLPPDTTVQYKYLKKNPDGTITWENGDNRTVFTTATGTETLNDIWR
ncbi:CBM20 domain-containing protein [Streptomyces cinerochromogenes]|uniref:CBM20 domain-containing protein n=1 Tax=Streptomyces cinerochromogenes TaxID=66422 RepID=UPI0033B276AB